jgi:hypothetical protein
MASVSTGALFFNPNINTMNETVWLMIKSDRSFATACLLKLYTLQLEEEQALADSIHRNKVGFTKSDALFLSGCAQILQSGHEISEAYWPQVIRRLEKYSTQLATYDDIIQLL